MERSIHDVVAEQHGEGLVAHVLAAHGHGVAQAQRLALAHVVDVGEVGELQDLLEQLVLALGMQVGLELDGAVEVILEGALAATGDDEDVVDPGRTASSTTYWIAGLSTTGSISLG